MVRGRSSLEMPHGRTLPTVDRSPGGTAAAGAAADRPRSRLVDLDWRSVLVALGAVVVLGIIIGLIRAAPRTTTSVVVAIFLVLALDPLVVWVQRRVHIGRGPAVGLVLSGFALAFGLVCVFL